MASDPRPPLQKYGGFLVAIAAILSLPIAYVLSPEGRWVRDRYSRELAIGTIIDAETGLGVDSAEVMIRSSGWQWPLGSMHERTQAFGQTDRNGRFRMTYRRIGETQLYVRRSGYATAIRPIFDTPKPATQHVSRVTPDAKRVKKTTKLWSPINDTQTIYFDLRTGGGAVDTNYCDFAFTITPDIVPVVYVRALGRAGFQPDSTALTYPGEDAIAARCLAPETGYVTNDSLPISTKEDAWFVRARDGIHYGRVMIRRSIHRDGPSSIPGGTEASLLVQSWFNPDGGRCVCRIPHPDERFMTRR
jgi:hypothetical protein